MRDYLREVIGRAFLVALLGSTVVEPVGAQDNRVPAAAGEQRPSWRFTFTPNLWASALSGRVGIGPATGEVDISFSDILDHFDFGFMGLFEARHHPWVIRTDLLYVSLSDERATRVGGGTLEIGQDQFTLQPELGYTLLSRPWGGIDGLVGARYWNLNVNLTVQPQEVTRDQDWVDGTLGAAVRYQPAERWHLFAKADVGAGGSDFTWQAMGGGGYDLGRCCTVVAAYRYLGVDYQSDAGFVYDVDLNGPAVGVTLHF